ncbi:hypothetical protein GE09DRAFT_1078997 [Coniochaeta sp. 2T2.1]|nr:hypothetical protein GE09DRAFT_1078997 [Coniochaeta sp. 2T2.1]
MSDNSEYGAPVPASTPNMKSDGRKHHRRPRVQLSCGECRSKKLSCDRQLPCQRCCKAGRPQLCSFASGARPSATPPLSSAMGTAPMQLDADLCDQLQQLKSEVARLKVRLADAVSGEGYHELHAQPAAFFAPPEVRDPGTVDSGQTLLPEPEIVQASNFGLLPDPDIQQHDPKEPFSRAAQGYYRQHSLFRFFAEIPEIFPLIKETANEHFNPRNIALRKAKWTTADVPSLDDGGLELLLPQDQDTELLLTAYFDNFEKVHRVVHVPSYHPASNPRLIPSLTTSRNNSTIALVLSMITVSVTIGPSNSSPPGSNTFAQYKRTILTWITALEKYLRLQTSKRRGLEYYQVSCLVYLAKRMNGIRKKRFWNETVALVQEAVMDGFHRDPPVTDSLHEREMKKRVWSTLRELDIQNSFDHRLPTLLHSLESDVAPPSNVDDDAFGESSDAISKDVAGDNHRFTRTSYQHLSANSFQLRLDISRSLHGSGTKQLGNEDLWRYTEQIYTAIDSLPRHTSRPSFHQDLSTFTLAKTMLICQLNDTILSLHRHRIQRNTPSYSSLSETLCYTTSLSTLTLSHNLHKLNLCRLPSLLREDVLTASLTLTRISLAQPPAPAPHLLLASPAVVDIDNMPHHHHDSPLPLLEQCLPIVEERYLKCFNGEPWCPLTMLGAMRLVRMHEGRESRQAAKAGMAARFVDLWYRAAVEHTQVMGGRGEQVGTVGMGEDLLGLETGEFDLGFDWDEFMAADGC